MKGFQVTFFTAEGRQHGRRPMGHWLVETIKALGIPGATMSAGVEGIGRDGKLHSAHFFELADQPIEVMVAVTDAQCALLFDRLEQEGVSVFYVKTPVEFGVVGDGKA